jgi:hypothetical protein
MLPLRRALSSGGSDQSFPQALPSFIPSTYMLLRLSTTARNCALGRPCRYDDHFSPQSFVSCSIRDGSAAERPECIFSPAPNTARRHGRMMDDEGLRRRRLEMGVFSTRSSFPGHIQPRTHKPRECVPAVKPGARNVSNESCNSFIARLHESQGFSSQPPIHR